MLLRVRRREGWLKNVLLLVACRLRRLVLLRVRHVLLLTGPMSSRGNRLHHCRSRCGCWLKDWCKCWCLHRCVGRSVGRGAAAWAAGATKYRLAAGDRRRYKGVCAAQTGILLLCNNSIVLRNDRGRRGSGYGDELLPRALAAGRQRQRIEGRVRRGRARAGKYARTR